jgi:hypothetical protein
MYVYIFITLIIYTITEYTIYEHTDVHCNTEAQGHARG